MLIPCCIGCTTTVVVVPPCSVPVDEIAAVARAARHLAAFRGRTRLAVTEACANIAHELTGRDVMVDRPLSQADAEAICAEAKPAIEARLDEGAELGAAVADLGDCYPYLSAQAECLADCGASMVCENACFASGVFQAGCRLPSIRVESSDAELQAALQAHFGAILGLDLFVAKHAGVGVDALTEALTDVQAQIAADPGCADERASFSELQPEVDVAFDELIELLSWVRISRLKELE